MTDDHSVQPLSPRSHRRADASPSEEAGALTLLGAANVLLRHRRLLAVGVGAGMALGVTLALMRQPSYSTTVMFMPRSSQGAGQLSSLASRFGFPFPQGGGAQSAEFYEVLIGSRNILEKVVEVAPVVDPQTGRHTTMVGMADERDTPSARREVAIETLARSLDIETNATTGIVTYRVQSALPENARSLAAALLEAVQEFNLRSRRSHASAEREFLEERVGEAQRELLEAEAELRLFLDRNREYSGSSQLRFEHGRLERAVALRQQLLITLSEALEQARMEEVRNTPVINVIQEPEAPVRRDPMGRLQLLLLCIAGGAFLALLLAFTRDLFSPPESDTELSEFERLRNEAVADLLRPARGVMSMFGRGSRRAS